MKQVHLLSTTNSISFETCEIDNFLGRSLFELRSAKKIALECVAQGLKISIGEYSAYENGLKKPTVDELIKIAHFFKIDPFDLIHSSIEKSKYFDTSNKSLRVKELSNKNNVLHSQMQI